MTAAPVADVKAVLAAAVAWLYDQEQPEGAVAHHLGPAGFRLGDRVYEVIAAGADGGPVIVVRVAGCDLAPGEWRGFEGEYSHRSYGGWTEPFPDGPCAEVLAVVEAVAGLGAEVKGTWNGAPHCTSGSIGLAARARPSLLAALARYHAGCPAHGSVFCGPGSHREADRDCTWYTDGTRLLVSPAWPSEGGEGSRG